MRKGARFCRRPFLFLLLFFFVFLLFPPTGGAGRGHSGLNPHARQDEALQHHPDDHYAYQNHQLVHTSPPEYYHALYRIFEKENIEN
jgi:hypothetical protein